MAAWLSGAVFAGFTWGSRGRRAHRTSWSQGGFLTHFYGPGLQGGAESESVCASRDLRERTGPLDPEALRGPW